MSELLSVLLLPLSWLYRLGLAAYLLPYKLGIRKRHRLPTRVVSVGNLTFGGNGKTPMVMAICEELLQLGVKPAILSRGHGGKLSGQGAIVSDGTGRRLNAVDCGDEPALLADALPGVPVVIGKDRRRMGRLLCTEFSPDVIVLDDGMQYWQLYRDVEIVVMRADAPFGTGRVLPAGDLREPVSWIGRADAVIITSTEAVEPESLEEIRKRLSILAPNAQVFLAKKRPFSVVDGGSGKRLQIEVLERMPVVAVSGIANPASFERMLNACGANILESVRFRDHCAYSSNEAEQIKSVIRRTGAKAVVTTAKDAVKLRISEKILVFDVKLIVDDMERLIHMTVGTAPEMVVEKNEA
jgi:tetraacyldisaccharide 4'-kinase